MPKRKKAPTRRSTSPNKNRAWHVARQRRHPDLNKRRRGSRADAAEICKVAEWTIAHWARRGIIRCYKSTVPYRYSLTDARRKAAKGDYKRRVNRRDPRRRRLSEAEIDNLLRTRTMLSVPELASILDVGWGTVCHWINRKLCPPIGRAIRGVELENGRHRIPVSEAKLIRDRTILPEGYATVQQVWFERLMGKRALKVRIDLKQIDADVRWISNGIKLTRNTIVKIDDVKREVARIREQITERNTADERVVNGELYQRLTRLVELYRRGNETIPKARRRIRGRLEWCDVETYSQPNQAPGKDWVFYHAAQAKEILSKPTKSGGPRQREPVHVIRKQKFLPVWKFAVEVGDDQRPIRSRVAAGLIASKTVPSKVPHFAKRYPDGITVILESEVAKYAQKFPTKRDPRGHVHLGNIGRIYPLQLSFEILGVTTDALQQQTAKDTSYLVDGRNGEGRRWTRKKSYAKRKLETEKITTTYPSLVAIIEKHVLWAAWNLKIELIDELRKRCHLAADHPWLWRPGETGEFPADAKPRPEHYLPGAVLPEDFGAAPAAGDATPKQHGGKREGAGRTNVREAFAKFGWPLRAKGCTINDCRVAWRKEHPDDDLSYDAAKAAFKNYPPQ